jgi:hypothetical protein
VLVPVGGGDPVAHAPVVPRRVPPTPADALGRPEVVASGGVADARVRVGTLERRGGRIASTRLHDLRLELVPAGGGDPLPVSHSARDGGWPQGVYRFLLSGRLASGVKIDPGRYTLRVRASGPDGRRLVKTSKAFRLTRQ